VTPARHRRLPGGLHLTGGDALADGEITSSSNPDRRRLRLGTICGSKLPSRSRGTSIWTGPISVTVLDRCPLREFPPSRQMASTVAVGGMVSAAIRVILCPPDPHVHQASRHR
jgi:hypothetical protein